MAGFPNAGGGAIVKAIAATIVENKAYLSEIDGKIGDGDHGVNMAKGFGRASERIGDDASLQEGFATLSDVLMSEIGGSMGPLYGMFFMEMADALEGVETIDGPAFAKMLRAGLEGVSSVGSANVGDKTMMDALVPAVEAAETGAGGDFAETLRAAKAAAETGRDSTRDMAAKIGRASRLGERSRGVLDAGATSCAMIVGGLCDGAFARLAQ
ncbi:MAG: dihydroxyacetone kinase subunit DhaL [Pseudomonadota bacterium]